MNIGRLDQGADYSIEGPSSRIDRLVITDNERDLCVEIRRDLKPNNQICKAADRVIGVLKIHFCQEM